MERLLWHKPPQPHRRGRLCLRVLHLLRQIRNVGVKTSDSCRYQLIFIANWNWRGSYAAVAVPALVNSGLTAETL